MTSPTLKDVDTLVASARRALLDAAALLTAMEDQPYPGFRRASSQRVHTALAATLSAKAEVSAALVMHYARGGELPDCTWTSGGSFYDQPTPCEEPVASAADEYCTRHKHVAEQYERISAQQPADL